jgi:hypothetical protein
MKVTELRDRAFRRATDLQGLGALSLSMILVAVAALWVSQRGDYWTTIGIGTEIVLASGVVGALLGFLFAIPRVLTKDEKDSDSARLKEAEGDPVARGRRLLGSNTNLERVSDWLTTMLVGVGLSQLTSINERLVAFRDFLNSALKGCGATCCNGCILPTVGPFLLILGATLGFLVSYVFTRTSLSRLFFELEWDFQNWVPEKAAPAFEEAAHFLSAASENPAFQNLISGSRPSVAEALNIMGNLLYRPEGYQQVIKLGGELSVTAAVQRAEYWFFLAAAFGQKYRAEKEANSPEQQSSRDNAIDCARRAVAIDPSYRSRLADLAQPGNLDDDLVALKDDPDFKKLIGKG